KIGSTISPVLAIGATSSGIGNGISAPKMWSLYSCENRIFVPKDSVNQPSQRVSPEAKNGRASASRRMSSGSHAGTSPKTALVKRAIGLNGANAGGCAASAIMMLVQG